MTSSGSPVTLIHLTLAVFITGVISPIWAEDDCGKKLRLVPAGKFWSVFVLHKKTV